MSRGNAAGVPVSAPSHEEHRHQARTNLIGRTDSTVPITRLRYARWASSLFRSAGLDLADITSTSHARVAYLRILRSEHFGAVPEEFIIRDVLRSSAGFGK